MLRLRSAICAALLLAPPGTQALSRAGMHLARPAGAVPSVTALELSEILNRRYDGIQSLSASFEFRAQGILKLKQPAPKTEELTGYLLLRKPGSLRLLALVPTLRVPVLDLASNGRTFQLVVAGPRRRAIIGADAVTHRKADPLKNLRPYLLFDSLLLKPVAATDITEVSSVLKVRLNPTSSQTEVAPEYSLLVYHRAESAGPLTRERLIRFDSDLRPFQEELYDAHGQIETEIVYGPVRTFGAQQFPASVTIRRPQQRYEIQFTFKTLKPNVSLTDDQFAFQIPAGLLTEHVN